MKHLYFSFCLMLSSCVCHATDYERMPNFSLSLEDDLTDQEIAHAKELAGPDLMLYGGRPVEEGDLPMVFNVGFCTVTVVGPEVIFIASHCVSNGSRATFVFKGERRNGICTRHPNYNGNTTQNDWAFCKFTPKIEDKDFVYSSLAPKLLSVGDKVVLNGFGKGSSNGRLHWGKMPISRVQGQEYITQGSVVLGSGDSGGSVFLDMEDISKGPFFTVAVNSRAGGQMSIFNYTAHENAQSFFKSYATQNSVGICGVNLECNNGGGAVDPPKPPDPPKPEPPGHCVEEKSFVKMAEAKLKLFQDMLGNCK